MEKVKKPKGVSPSWLGRWDQRSAAGALKAERSKVTGVKLILGLACRSRGGAAEPMSRLQVWEAQAAQGALAETFQPGQGKG